MLMLQTTYCTYPASSRKVIGRQYIESKITGKFNCTGEYLNIKSWRWMLQLSVDLECRKNRNERRVASTFNFRFTSEHPDFFHPWISSFFSPLNIKISFQAWISFVANASPSSSSSPQFASYLSAMEGGRRLIQLLFSQSCLWSGNYILWGVFLLWSDMTKNVSSSAWYDVFVSTNILFWDT